MDVECKIPGKLLFRSLTQHWQSITVFVQQFHPQRLQNSGCLRVQGRSHSPLKQQICDLQEQQSRYG